MICFLHMTWTKSMREKDWRSLGEALAASQSFERTHTHVSIRRKHRISALALAYVISCVVPAQRTRSHGRVLSVTLSALPSSLRTHTYTLTRMQTCTRMHQCHCAAFLLAEYCTFMKIAHFRYQQKRACRVSLCLKSSTRTCNLSRGKQCTAHILVRLLIVVEQY